MNKKYILNSNGTVNYKGKVILTPLAVADAMDYANTALRKLNDTTMQFDINIFETLGMRNLSGMIGEYFAQSIAKFSQGRLTPNLHQDGYPDLLLIDDDTKKNYLKTLYTMKCGRKYPIDKKHFSPFKYGGIEIKATCGSTPSASKLKNITKPLIGEQRVELINSFDWKAHHRETNHLLAVLWDFIDGYPTFVASFYQDNLTTEDWGTIIQPKVNGGRTTSVSIMKSNGVKKMCQNWIAVINDPAYIELLSKTKWIGKNVR